jgi:hypothetical protein
MDPVLAYIDAGSGSLIIQALIAALVAAPFVFRQQLGRVVRRLRGEPQPAATPTDATPTDIDPAG